MKLESFEIQNFRCISETKCFVSPRITVLAGKNESGKTTILNAVERLNGKIKFTDADRPSTPSNEKPTEIRFNFLLDEKEKELLLEQTEINPADIPNEINIKISNEIQGYDITGPSIDRLRKEILQSVENERKLINESIKSMKEIIAKGGSRLNLKEIEPTLESKTVIENSQQLASMQIALSQQPGVYAGISAPMIQEGINKIKPILEAYQRIESITNKIIKMIPNVVLFESFEEKLPSEVPYAEIIDTNTLNSKHKLVGDFLTLFEVDVQGLGKDDTRLRAKITSKANKISSDIFGTHWHQDPIEVEIGYDNPKVTFFIKDQGKDHPFKPEERSKGLQWYLAFFARLKAQGVKKNNLILVDEPALYLHSKAQEDVLNTLEELADDNQVIFTTHSPYLIDPNKLERVRLVKKDTETNYSKIENNINKGGDYETLTPIITAIGLDIVKGLSFAKKSNIVLEGISDYYYVQAMKLYLKEKEGYEFPDDVAFIPCVGQSKVGAVTSILIGYGLDYKIVLDKKGTIKNYNKLIKDGIDTNKIIRIGDNEDQSIEDLFSEEDLNKYQLKSDQQDSKTLISKKFYQTIEIGKDEGFSTETLQRFRSLFDSLKDGLTTTE